MEDDQTFGSFSNSSFEDQTKMENLLILTFSSMEDNLNIIKLWISDQPLFNIFAK